jgi:hypothetical protein
MPIPQVNDRIKEAPAVMLRAVFAGVGQLLLAADRVRSRAAGTSWPADRTAPKGRAQSRWHTLDDTRGGTATLARERADSYSHSAPRPSASTTTSPAPATAARPARTAPATSKTAVPAPAKQAAQPEAAVQAMPAKQPASPAKTAIGGEPTGADEPAVQAAPTADAPPLPGYDDLSLPSLRARMRVLDAAALRTLLAYEKAHAHRDDVIAMFERRLAKITAA